MVATSYAKAWRGAIAAAALFAASPAAAQTPLRVAAAADLKFALDEVVAAYRNAASPRIDVIYGSSGNLTRQILEGAPYDLFLSADETFVYQLADAGRTVDRGALYAVGRLALFAPHGSPLTPDPDLNGLQALLERGALTRFAIANPAHAPYGRAAEAVLRARGLWERLQPRLVLGDNVAQAAQFAATGGAAGGLVAYSLVLAAPLEDQGTYVLVPAERHPPLRQRMVILKRAGPGAAAFYAYLQQPAARAILSRYGFSTE